MTNTDDLLNEYFKQTSEIPQEVNCELHGKLVKAEMAVLKRNSVLITVLTALCSLVIFAASFCFFGGFVALLFTSGNVIFTLAISVVLTAVSCREERGRRV